MVEEPGDVHQSRSENGYDKAADIAKESFKTGKTIRQIAQE